MRSVLLRLHRYIGLTIAAFLILAGLTGAVISWDSELDRWINSDLYTLTSSGELRSPYELAAIVEAREPRGRVTFMPLQFEPGQTARFTVRPRVNPRTGEPFALGYTHVFVDPVTGVELGRRDGDGATLSRQSLIPFLIRFHYSLQVPEMWGIADWGVWLTGTVALAWLINSLMAIFLTLPLRRCSKGKATSGKVAKTEIAGTVASERITAKPPRGWWQRWKPSWRVRWRGGSNVLNFDLHRAGALWAWPLLLTLAFTGFSQNLLYSILPEPFDAGVRPTSLATAEPTYGYAEIVRSAKQEADRLGWAEPAAAANYDQEANVYNVFFRTGEELGNADVGSKTVYLDGNDKRVLGSQTRWSGSAAEVYTKLQFPLHSLRILGFPGRILISLLGLVVATLSLTGVVIWARKRRFARPNRAANKRRPVDAASGYAR